MPFAGLHRQFRRRGSGGADETCVHLTNGPHLILTLEYEDLAERLPLRPISLLPLPDPPPP